MKETKKNTSLRFVANKEIKEGEIITIEKISCKKCKNAKALIPLKAKELLSQIARTTIQANEPITLEDIEKPKITIAVICRLKSTRLPKKALLPINGIPSIERCLLNCLAIPEADQVVLATSHLPEDDPLEKFTMDGRVKIVRGDPDNVAERMLQAAELTNANIIIRITGDDPAVSPEITSYLIQQHLKSGADFTQAKTSPMGVASNVITVEALRRLTNYPKPLTHTEYLSFYFINNPSLFSINNVELPTEFDYPSWRLTLDEPKDLEMFEELYKNLNVKRKPLFFQQLKEYIVNNPKITQINKDISVKWIDQKSLVEEINQATLLES
ncbi:cytidylyltransferase domain-containing protein [Bacillus bingmayongensis]|uniref:cytidylyltransferase domain-containing protein n=1 Tax=Bacillus bingmayongensis TaxID=1150157 RepID=UPI0002D9EAC8|nr:SAF domain-containing protein [Bacillus bingmayongensis]MBY0600232.1 spore coat protein [Bacillus bingmayongensis]